MLQRVQRNRGVRQGKREGPLDLEEAGTMYTRQTSDSHCHTERNTTEELMASLVYRSEIDELGREAT